MLSVQDLARGALPQPLFDYQALLAFLQQIRGRLIIVGLGANTLSESPRELVANMAAPVRDVLELMFERAEAIGVRGAYTKATLEEMGYTKAQVIGCPTFFSRASQIQHQGFRKDRDRFAYGGDYIPEQFDLERDYFVAQDELPVLRMLAPEQFTEDDEERWLQTDPGWRTPLAPRLKRLTAAGRAAAFSTPYDWSDFLERRVDAVVGGRLHGGVAALSRGVPLLLTNPDMRTREFAAYMKFPYAPGLPLTTPRSQLADLIDMRPMVENYGDAVAAFQRFFEQAGLNVDLD